MKLRIYKRAEPGAWEREEAREVECIVSPIIENRVVTEITVCMIDERKQRTVLLVCAPEELKELAELLLAALKYP